MHLFSELVRGTALMALEATAIADLVDHGTFTPWAMGDETLRMTAASRARWELEGKTCVTAVCPISGLQLGEGQTIDLGAGARLSNWDERTRFLHKSRYPDVYEWNDFRSPTCDTVLLEVIFDSEHGATSFVVPNPLVTIVRDRIDIAKAALFAAVATERPFSEGVCTIVIREGQQVGKINREARQGHGNHIGTLDNSTIARAGRLHTEFMYGPK